MSTNKISDPVIELLHNSESTSLIFVAILILPKVTNRILQRPDCNLHQTSCPVRYCRKFPKIVRTLLSFLTEYSRLMYQSVKCEHRCHPDFSLSVRILQTLSKRSRLSMPLHFRTSCCRRLIYTRQTKRHNITTAHFPLCSHPAWANRVS